MNNNCVETMFGVGSVIRDYILRRCSYGVMVQGNNSGVWHLKAISFRDPLQFSLRSDMVVDW
jgi:hypothetical protein